MGLSPEFLDNSENIRWDQRILLTDRVRQVLERKFGRNWDI